MKKLIAVAVMLSGCASVPLTGAEAAVRILRNSDAPASCRELGRVMAPRLASLTDQGMEDDLKRATAKLAGDTVTIASADRDGNLFGIVYACAGAR